MLAKDWRARFLQPPPSFHTRAMHKIRLLLSFYRSAMLPFGVSVSVVLAGLAARFGLPVVVWLLGAKLVFLLLYGYLWLLPVYGREFPYYRNLGIRPRALLGAGGAFDVLLFVALVTLACVYLYPLDADATC